MNLKEAFRYQNFLDSNLSKITEYLSYNQNVTKTTQKHLRNKANPEAQDEELDTTKDRQIEYPVNTLIDFVSHILEQKEKLSIAINDAKSSCGLDIDSAVSINKKKQEVARVFSRMGNIKPSETIKRGTAYKFNAEGNQTTYAYDINEVSVIDFDRNKVKAIAKRLVTEADEVSTKLDKIMIDTEVVYSPIYDVNDSFDDVLEQYITNTK